MKFEGEKQFPLPPKEVFAKLSDARFLVECIPNRVSVSESNQHTAVCTQRPGLAFVSGNLTITIKILEATPETSVKYSAFSKGVGASSDVETVMTLTPKDAGTHLQWSAEIKSLGGLLKAVPSGLIQGAAHKLIGEVWHEVEKRLK